MAASLVCAQASTCIRGDPEPVLRAPAQRLAKHQFRRTHAKEAIETISLPRGDSFRLDHSGCEYYVIAFTVRPRQTGIDRLHIAAKGLRQLAALKPDIVFDLQAAAVAMEEVRRAGVPLVDGEEHPVAGDGEDFLQTRFVFDSAPRGAVRFRLFKGPL